MYHLTCRIAGEKAWCRLLLVNACEEFYLTRRCHGNRVVIYVVYHVISVSRDQGNRELVLCAVFYLIISSIFTSTFLDLFSHCTSYLGRHHCIFGNAEETSHNR